MTYYERNREKMLAYSKKYKKDHPEKTRENALLWRKKNPDKINQWKKSDVPKAIAYRNRIEVKRLKKTILNYEKRIVEVRKRIAELSQENTQNH